MYAEFLTDAKVQMLSEINQRRYIMLLCMRCSNGDVTLHDTEIAFQLRISDEEWQKTKAILRYKNLITDDNKPTNWEKRQYASDTSVTRVAKHRAKKKTGVKRGCNVTVTAPDTDTDTEITTNVVIKESVRQAARSTKKSAQKKIIQQATAKQIQQADELIDYLNLRANRSFEHSECSREHALKALNNHTPSDLKLIVDYQIAHWQHTENESYLRPSTLFNNGKQADYIDAANEWNNRGRPASGRIYTLPAERVSAADRQRAICDSVMQQIQS